MDYPPQATFSIRLSLMKPKAGNEDRVLEIQEQLLKSLPGEPGFVRAYLIVEGDPQARIGHLSVYQTEQDAGRIAQNQRVLSLRAELMQLIEEDSHAEHSYTAIDPQLDQSAP